jgi:hypothetical protein
LVTSLAPVCRMHCLLFFPSETNSLWTMPCLSGKNDKHNFDQF